MDHTIQEGGGTLLFSWVEVQSCPTVSSWATMMLFEDLMCLGVVETSLRLVVFLGEKPMKAKNGWLGLNSEHIC